MAGTGGILEGTGRGSKQVIYEAIKRKTREKKGNKIEREVKEGELKDKRR